MKGRYGPRQTAMTRARTATASRARFDQYQERSEINWKGPNSKQEQFLSLNR